MRACMLACAHGCVSGRVVCVGAWECVYAFAYDIRTTLVRGCVRPCVFVHADVCTFAFDICICFFLFLPFLLCLYYLNQADRWRL